MSEKQSSKDGCGVCCGKVASIFPLFNPKTVAVVGATEKPNSVGRTVLWNLISSPFGGTVYPINPNRSSVLGIKAYPSLAACPGDVDLIVVCTPAKTVKGIIAEAAQEGVKGAVVISAGFKEIGPEGAELERQLAAEAAKTGMRIIGPNCLGIMNPVIGLNASFAPAVAAAGSIAFISQSGALGCAVLDWCAHNGVGLSHFSSIGSMMDVNWGDLISYLGEDESTHSIVIYMETIGDAPSFLEAASKVTPKKPIFVIKPGRTESAAKAAASHTGSMTGSDDVLDAAFKRVGVVRLNEISEVFHMFNALSRQPLPQGNRLTVITNAGGPGVLCTDALLLSGGVLAEVGSKTIEELNTFLPAAWSRSNPVDILGDASPDAYARTLEIVGRDEGGDGFLVILTPQAMSRPTETAEKVKAFGKIKGKPVYASWLGGGLVAAGQKALMEAGIPVFPEPDTAAETFTTLYKYKKNLEAISAPARPPAKNEDRQQVRAKASALIDEVRASGRTILTEYESKKLLSIYGVNTVQTEIAKTEEDAVKLAEGMKFPVVAKLLSETITHKTDVGGVKLNLQSPEDVRKAFVEIRNSVSNHPKWGAEHFQGVTIQQMIKQEGYEIILGSSLDGQFGPVLLFGMGGQLVEVFKDKALGLPPLNNVYARMMLEETKIFTALKGVRGRKSVDIKALEDLMVQFSLIVADQPWIKEVDINPLLASEEQIIALDARVILHDLNTPAEKLSKPAIQF